MLRHLFLLIWNKKRTHTLLLVEITASFLVLFGVASLLTYNVRNYREPLGFSYENVWAIDLNSNLDSVAIGQKVQTALQRLKSYPEIESVSRMSTNFPFSANTSSNMISHGDAKVQANFFTTDENFAQTLAMPLVAGRWYRNADSVGKFEPIVINRKAQEALFAGQNPLGQLVSDRYKVIGVVANFKSKGEYGTDMPALFELVDAASHWHKTMLIRVRPGTDAVFEAKLVHDLTTLLPGWSSEITYLVDSRQNQHNLTQIPVIIFVIVSSFLLLNVALGLFGGHWVLLKPLFPGSSWARCGYWLLLRWGWVYCWQDSFRS